MRKLLLFIYIFFSATLAIAQSSKIDSLEKELRKAKDADKAGILNQLARLSLQSNPENAEKYSLQAIELSEHENEEKALAYHQLGVSYYYRYMPEKATEFYNKSIEINQRISNYFQLAKTYNNLGILSIMAGDYETSLERYRQSLHYSRQAGDSLNVAITLSNMSNIYFNKGEYANSLKLNEASLGIYQILNNSLGMAENYTKIGQTYSNLGDYDNAIKKYFDALVIQERLGHKQNAGNTLYNISGVYSEWSQYDLSNDYAHQAIKKFKESNHKVGIGYGYLQLSVNEFYQDRYDSAISYLDSALFVFTDINDENSIAKVYYEFANNYLEKGEYNKSTKYIKLAISQFNKVGDKKSIAISLNVSSKIKESLGDIPGAIKDASKALIISKEIENKLMISNSYKLLADIYIKTNDYKKSLENFHNFHLYRDSLFNEKKSKQIAELNTLYDTQKKEAEIIRQKSEIELKNASIAQKNLLSRALFGGIFALLIILGLIAHSLINKQRVNRQIMLKNQEIEYKNMELEQANEEIRAQRDEIECQRDMVMDQKDRIEEQKKKIIDSIRYAQRIQAAVLPSESNSKEMLGNHFVIFRPKDVVSGDFYWATRVANWLIVTVADCTGHGVPGAFMSMLGISFLNEIVRKKEIVNPAQILKELRSEVIDALGQTYDKESQKDGMDISLAAIDMEAKKCFWAGAGNPLWIIRSESLNRKFEDPIEMVEVFKPDTMTVAINNRMDDYTCHETILHKGDRLFLFSDGIIDQFGGPTGKKFMSKQLKKNLADTASKPLGLQKQSLEDTLQQWQNPEAGVTYEQIDDITIIGIEV